uniref:Secreted protein n=1 Tax=Oryza barthii TaxID=65489 RepID=A0A0D3HRN6_9ORYZ
MAHAVWVIVMGFFTGVWVDKCDRFALWWEAFSFHNNEVVSAAQILSSDVAAIDLVTFIVSNPTEHFEDCCCSSCNYNNSISV